VVWSGGDEHAEAELSRMNAPWGIGCDFSVVLSRRKVTMIFPPINATVSASLRPESSAQDSK
jgi:hypothetical protein